MRVVIVGAGIGGLCLAQGLRRVGIDVTVFEQSPAGDARGDRYRLHISPAGMTALRRCLTPDDWQVFLETSGRPGGGFGFLDQGGNTLAVVNDSLMYPTGQWFTADREALRSVLAHDVDVQHGLTFDRFEPGLDGRVVARFTDGTAAAGDLLVGADGAASRVRPQLRPDAEPIDTGALGIGLKLPLTSFTRGWLPPRLGRGENMVLSPDPYFLFTSIFERELTVSGPATHGRGEPPVGNYLFCGFVTRREALPGWPDEPPIHLHEAVQDLASHWHPELRRVLAECDPLTVRSFPFAVTPRLAPWRPGPITLIGDAAHTMPPIGGLGANIALRDAFVLTDRLAATSSVVDAVGHYESVMRPYAHRAAHSAVNWLRLGLLSNPIALAAVKAGLRLTNAVTPLRRAVFANTWTRHSPDLGQRRASAAVRAPREPVLLNGYRPA